MKLEKREYRFSHAERVKPGGQPLLKQFALPQRDHTPLPADKKPKHGVSQEMPPRDAP